MKKEEQKKHLIDMMKDDEELGLYDIFNDEKRQGVKELIDAHKQGRDKIENDFLKCLSDSKVVYEPKQETLEEASTKYADSNNPSKDKEDACYWYASWLGFRNGAKWQQERSYSEEDMAESFMACWKANVPEGFECKLSFKEWFEQFKKK